MKPISKMIATSVAALSALALIAIAAPAAQAGEFCKTDISGMRGCGFATMEQCQAMVSGVGGSCARDPFYLYHNPNNALAYAPKQTHSRSGLHPTKKPAGF